jgi:xanthine dehydrogenase accessory factor
MDAVTILDKALSLKEPAVLATIVATEGHAYRKPGAAMLLLRNGGRLGSISPGCLEADLEERIDSVLEAGIPETVHYNMRPEEDVIWGEAVGCGGEITVLLEPLGRELLQSLAEIRARLETGSEGTLYRRRSGRTIQYAVEPPDVLAQTGGSRPSSPNERYASKFAPPEKLFLFGSGSDAQAIAESAERVGFRVRFMPDHGQRSGDGEGCAGGVCETPRRPEANPAIGQGDYVIICSHNMRLDRDALEAAVRARPSYIGIMGSGKRIDLLMKGLAWTPNIHAPIGLDIGAQGAEEIAVSVVSELIAVRARLQSAAKEESNDDNRGYLSGRWPEQEDGLPQGIGRARAGTAAWTYSAY